MRKYKQQYNIFIKQSIPESKLLSAKKKKNEPLIVT